MELRVLEEHPCYGGVQGFYGHTSDAPRRILFFRSTSMSAHQSAAAGGLGIALLPSFTAATDIRLRPALHGQVEVKRDLWLAT